MRKITIRIPEKDYQILQVNIAKNGETMSHYLRKIINREIQNDAALTNQDALISAVRKAIRLELKSTENRLANLIAKTAISSAATENLVAYMIKNNYSNFEAILYAGRKKGVAFIREPLDQIIKTYEEIEVSDK